MRFDGVVKTFDSLSGDGSELQAGLTRYGAVATGQVGAKYAEAVARGRVFRGQTAVTGVAPGTSVGTTAAFSLYNPAGSGVNLVLLQVSMGYVSGTLGAGSVVFTASTNTVAAATTGTAITVANALIGGAASAVGKPFTTATLPATPTVIGPFCSLGASLASSVVAPWQVYREVDGGIVVSPGATVSLQGVAAGGTSPLVMFGAMWEELPA